MLKKISPEYLFSALLGVIIGVIANILYSWLVSSSSQVTKFVTANLIPWIIVGMLSLILFVIIFVWRSDAGRRDRWLALDDSMLRLLPSLISANDLHSGLHKLVGKLLRTAYESFPFDIRRGVLLLPDENKEYLRIWEQVGWKDEENKGRVNFYIGQKESLQKSQGGLAGKVFSTRETLVTSFKTKKDLDKAVGNGYIIFDHDKKEQGGNYPPYKSLISVPILARKDGIVCLGVVCFDSKESKAFDSQEIKEKLEILARHIGAALIIYDELKQLHDELKQLQKP